jgi:archaellum component FlaC
MDTATTTVIFQLIGLFVTVGTAAWALSMRLERLKTMLESHSTLMDERMKAIDREMMEMKGVVKESRQGRAEIWSEVNELRERATRLETKIEE